MTAKGVLWAFLLTEKHKPIGNFLNRAPAYPCMIHQRFQRNPFSRTDQWVLSVFHLCSFIELFRTFIWNPAYSAHHRKKTRIQATLILN